MKKIYCFVLLSIFIAGCSKDVLKRYEKRIEGVWQLVDVDRVGIGGSTSNVTFSDGQFTFSRDGQLKYTDNAGNAYNGSWDIRREWRRGSCNTDDNGNRNCDDKQVKTLRITAINFTSQDVKTEYFDEMVFTGTNRFNAYVYSGFHTYVFRFRR